MLHEDDNRVCRYFDFALIGDPVGHSLSPVMHNTLYRYLAKERAAFTNWRYCAVQCPDEKSALKQIGYVRTGHYRGMNITMPYKRLALDQADFVDSSADAAGGANVLVRKGYDLYAYNTDGLGALGAIVRTSGRNPKGLRVAVCGTGPTSVAIAAAFANAKASEVVVFSREHERARRVIERLRLSLVEGATFWLRSASYEDAPGLIPSMDIIVDATPSGMNPDDESVIPVELFHEGQVVLDTVYAHGITRIVGGAREQGAYAMDGLEMLVEQAALSVEIWAEALGIEVTVPREVMRDAATSGSGALQ